MKVNVIGAGINGLASAVGLAEQFPNCDITITSADWHPKTTSNHGLGLVMLDPSDNVDPSNPIYKYTMQTIGYCQRFDPKLSEETGIRLRPSVVIAKNRTAADRESAKFTHLTGFNTRLATEKEISELDFDFSKIDWLHDEEIGKKDIAVILGSHYVIDTNQYLVYLLQKLSAYIKKNGEKRIKMVKKRLTCLEDLEASDLIVNCSGLGAKDLVGDQNVYPVRGQYLSLVAPEQDRILLCNHTSVIPRLNEAVIGSVHQAGKLKNIPDPNDTADILRRVEVLFPGVRKKEIRKIGVGIRPARVGGIRLELEFRSWRNKETPVIHNYGHGSNGIKTHFGCAVRVCSLAAPFLLSESKL